MRYTQVYDDVWFFPSRKGYRMACCDCGLVHDIYFKWDPRNGGRAIALKVIRNK